MSDIDKGPGGTDPDSEIARRFTQLRALEAASAPDFSPAVGSGSGRAPKINSWTASRTLPRVAAAAALVAIALTLLRESPQEDPAALYAGIMENQQVQTDSLLIVSDSILPAMSPLPSLYDIEAEVDTGTYTN